MRDLALFASCLLLISLGSSSATPLAYGDAGDEFTVASIVDFMQWIKEFGKAYETNEILFWRFQVYTENDLLVQKLNRLYAGTTEFRLNQFADMSPNEFRQRVLMRPNRQATMELEKYDENFLAEYQGEFKLPSSFDWRPLGAVTPVKDQGSVGTCWAFSTVQNIEGQFKLKGNQLTNLSVEQVVDCDGTNRGEQADCGVYGGWPFIAIQYVKEAGGLSAEADYPYCVGIGGKDTCYPCSAPGYNKSNCGPPIPYCMLKDSCQAKLNPDKFVPNLKVIDWKRISTNETDIAAQLMAIGPLSVALNAEMLQFYHRGIFDPIMCDPEALDHAVLLVGWGSEKSVIHGTREFWIVKNSWGEKWGESGYFRILRDKGKCGINTQVVTAILE